MSAGKFILQEKLNESATTTVYKAHQSALDRTVLLKILHRHLADDPQIVSRFGREARACALIRSEYIVQVYDLTEIEGAPAIVMEFVDGTSLKDVLAREGALSAERTRTIAIEALSALKAAHARGVIHRDVKPGNMLMTPAGHIKVTDFGLAAVTAAQTVTMEGAILGTPAYLPPEHIRGEAADERSDLFSLGATLLETVSGKRIFEGATYSACIHNILHFDPAVVDTLVPDASLAAVIKRLMQPERSLRYASAAEALAALEGKTEATLAPNEAGSAASSGRAREFRIAAFAVVLGLIFYALFSYRPAEHAGSPVAAPAGGGEEPSTLTQTETLRMEQPASPPPAEAKREDKSKPAVLPPVLRDAQQSAQGNGRKAAAALDSASLSVTCIPWAKVFLDSQYIGETPIGGAVAVAPGTHTVSFTNPQFTPIVKTITAKPGARMAAAGNFFETAGYVVINVVPWADVFIDGQYRDTTPIEKPMAVSAGRRRIRLHNPGFADAVYEVTVATRDTLRLSYSLTRNK